MTKTRLSLTALMATLLVLLGLALAPAASASTAVKELAFTSTLRSVAKYEQTMGSTQYGVNILVGSATVSGQRVQIQRMSVTNYVNGDGPISGFLTLTWPNGSKIGMSVTGESELYGSRTKVHGTMRVISATGQWKGYGGIGDLLGTRNGPIGTPVSYRFQITLTKG